MAAHGHVLPRLRGHDRDRRAHLHVLPRHFRSVPLPHGPMAFRWAAGCRLLRKQCPHVRGQRHELGRA